MFVRVGGEVQFEAVPNCKSRWLNLEIISKQLKMDSQSRFFSFSFSQGDAGTDAEDGEIVFAKSSQ